MGPCACSPRPGRQGSLPHGSGRAGAQRRLSSSGQRAGVGLWTDGVGGGRAGGMWAGRVDVPILLRGAVSGLGGPEGPGRLVEGGAGCKGVPRGVRGWGQGLGGDRAGRAGRGGDLARVGCPPGAERTAALQPHPHTSGLRLRGRGDSGFKGFKGPIWER